ncbi:gluconokinase [Colwellia sp. MEBiC06753]
MRTIESRLIVIMGISGTGKSTLALALAQRLNCYYVDADDFHTNEAKHLMAQGIAISEQQRQQWVDNLIADLSLKLRESATAIVLAFSGLKSCHRKQIAAITPASQFVLLHGDETIIEQRLNQRQGHFASSSLLPSQLAQFEAINSDDPDTIVLKIDQNFDQLLANLLAQIN